MFEVVEIDGVKVTPDGALTVSLPAPVAPAGKTAVIRTARANIVDTTPVRDTYVIPNGVVLTVQSCSGGAQNATACSRVTVYYSASGVVDANAEILACFYVQGNSYQSDVQREFTGNGTRAIILERQAFGSTTREVYGQWKGYY